MVTPGRIVTAAPTKLPAPDGHRRGHGGEVRLQRMVAVADVGVGEDEHALGEGDLVLEPDPLREVEQALVAQEAVVARCAARPARAGRG